MTYYKSKLLVLFIFVSFSLPLLFSCNGDSSGKTGDVINVEKAVRKFTMGNLGDYFGSIDYIRLETTDSSLLGNITGLCCERGLIFISDDNNVCRIFDREGKYIRSINRIGRGPEEYLTIRDMHVSPETGNIFLMDDMGVITEFDLSGNFKRKITSPDNRKNYLGFTILNNNLIAASIFTILPEEGISESGIIIYDTLLNIKSKYLRQSGKIEIKGKDGDTKILTVKMDPFLINKFPGNVVLSSNNSDTLFLMDEKFSFSPWYIFNFGKYSADPVDLVTNKVEDNSSVITKFATVFLTDKNLFVNFKMRGVAPEPFENPSFNLPVNIKPSRNTNAYGVYNRGKGVLTLLKQPAPGKPGLKDNLKGGPPFWPRFISSGNEMINTYDALELILLQEERGTEFEGISQITKGLKEEDNPVIAIAKLK